MNVFFDSTALCADYYFSSKMFKTVSTLAKIKGYKLYLPEVVKMEVERKHREALEKLLKFDAPNNTDYGLFAPHRRRYVFASLRVEVFKAVMSYPAALTKCLKEANIQIIPIPEISHTFLISKCLLRLKPFPPEASKSGGGYRDALIWVSILRVAEKDNERAIFITGNTKDFYENADGHTIHPHLREYGSAPETCDRFTLYQTLEPVS